MIEFSSIKLSQLPRTTKLVISFALVILGIGYLIALVNLYFTYSLTDGEPGLTAGDLKRAFYGNRDNTRLAAKIHGGSMEQFLPNPGDKEKILSWIQDGASQDGYDDVVAPILMQNCVRCHNPEGLQRFRPLTTYVEVMTVVKIDRGEPIGRNGLLNAQCAGSFAERHEEVTRSGMARLGGHDFVIFKDGGDTHVLGTGFGF